MNKYVVEFCNNDSVVIESKYEMEEKALNELIVKRTIKVDGVTYICNQIVKIAKVN